MNHSQTRACLVAVCWALVFTASCVKKLPGNQARCVGSCQSDQSTPEPGDALVPKPQSVCGDGKRSEDEACDDGARNGQSKACTPDCQANVCGDGYRLENKEACDDGNTELERCAYGETGCIVCSPACRPVFGETAYCGDGITHPDGGEACDPGSQVRTTCPYGHLRCKVCGADCQWMPGTPTYCGDGVKQAEEACDDGNFVTETCAYGSTGCKVCAPNCALVNGATTYCGDGIIQSDKETCEASGPGCTECQTDPGYRCTSTCATAFYRLALIDSGGLRVRDFSVNGTAVTVRDVLRGNNPASERPSWSWDGSLVAYPVGDYINETYLYESSGVSGALTSFIGTEPSFSDPPLRVLGRASDDYFLWTEASSAYVATPIAGAQVRGPQWEPGNGARFGFIDAVSGALILQEGASGSLVKNAAQRFAWHPDGERLAVVSGSGTCTLDLTTVQGASVGPVDVVATAVPCDAAIAFAPSGGEITIATGTKLYRLPLGTTYDLATDQGLAYSGAGNVLDVSYTPDSDFVVALAYVSGASGVRRVSLLAKASTVPVHTTITCDCNAMALSPVTTP